MAQEEAQTPYRQIRALYDEHTITVYQAYSTTIAEAAVREQKLYASPDFLFTRMTWIKPSWCWMMYRSGHSTKDKGQEAILALKMKHEHFQELLSHAAVTDDGLSAEGKKKPVRVQWDPERSPALQGLPYRSIQIGISRDLSRKWSEEWIESIEDVTTTALELKDAISEARTGKNEKSLIQRGLVPVEREYEVSKELRSILHMDVDSKERD